MINATVSHEMRNPLNCIVSQNKVNEVIYKNLKSQIDNLSLDTKTRDSINTEIAKLQYSNKIQKSSGNLLQHVIQDLLDYAQIRNGKFQQNFQMFDIKQAVYEIINIQKE